MTSPALSKSLRLFSRAAGHKTTVLSGQVSAVTLPRARTRRGGVIAALSVENGRALASRGQTVTEGATLVSGSVCEGAEDEAPPPVSAEDILNTTPTTTSNEGEEK